MRGRKCAFVLVCLAVLAGPPDPLPASEPLQVVATIPVLKEFADRVGGPHVRVVSLLSGSENEHTYSPKPSDLVAVRKAQVFIQIGLGLEVWVDALVRNAGNRDLLVVTTSDTLAREAAEVPDADAHGHGFGNPHVWLDPENAKVMVGQIAAVLAESDPGHAEAYRANHERYVREIDALEAELAARLRRVTDRRIVAHHPAWPYFARRFGFEIAGEIILQSGTEPSARHIQGLIRMIRDERIRVIVSEPQLNQKLPQMLARETGARVVVLTAMPGGLPGTGTYLDMLRHNVSALAKALEAS